MTILNYDESGFIVGINRMNQGIKAVSEDTQEIVQILKSQNQIANTRMAELTRAVNNAAQAARQQNSQNSVNNQRQRRQAPIDQSSQPPPVNPRTTSQAPRARNANPNPNANPNANRPAPIVTDDTSRRDIVRERDANGRFTRRASNRSDTDTDTDTDSNGNPRRRERDANGRFTSKSALTSAIDSIKGLAKGGGGTGSVDPLIESFKETKELSSPLGRGAKFSLSKLKAMKRREPLPIDQDRHNNENEKLLDKIWKAILKNGSGEGGGLGGLLGGRGRDRGRNRRRNRRRNRGGGLLNRARDLGGRGLRAVGGVKGLGAIGAVAGLGALAMNWKDLDHKEKSASVGSAAGGTAGAVVGGTIGSVVPVVGTAVGAVVGGYLGSKGGEIIGETVSPHVQSWTANLSRYNLAGKMDDFWKKGIRPFFTRMDALAGKMSAWIGSQATNISNGVSATGAGLSEALGLSGLGSVSEKYESGGRGVRTVSTGAGDRGGVSYGTHQLSSKTGTMAAFLKSPDGKAFAGEFAGLSAGSAAFNAKYKDVANRRGDEFKKAQKNYITRTHYMPAKKNAESYGFDMSNRGIQEAIYSHSTQYGPNHKSRFKRVAESGVDMKDNQAVLKALYADKAAYVNKDFASSSPSVRAGVAKRIQAEKADVLAISKVSDVKDTTKDAAGKVIDKAKDVVTQKQPSTKQTGKSAASQAVNNNSALGVQVGNMRPSKTTESANNQFADNKPLIFKSSTNTPASNPARVGLGDMKMTNNITARNSFMPASNQYGYESAGLPLLPNIKIPKVPVLKQRLDSGGNNNQMMVASNNENISQNVTDRDLAHAITGGLGHSQMWG